MAIGHLTRRLGSRFELSAHGSRIRTTSLDEFSYTIDASDQMGGGTRLLLTPSLQLVADGSVVSCRRTGTSKHQPSASHATAAPFSGNRQRISCDGSGLQAVSVASEAAEAPAMAGPD